MFALCILSALLFGDEEAVIDMSDLGHSVVWSVGAALLSVIFENVCRALYGQFSEKDRQTFLFAGSFFCSMVLYFGFVWFVFFLHVTSPLLIDGVESSALGWFFADLLSTILLKTTLVWALLLLTWEATIRLGNTQLGMWSLVVCSLGLVTLLWVWVWDFLGRALQSSVAQNAQEASTPLGKSQSGKCYEYSLANSGFDWYAGACRPYVFYFTDFASLLLCGFFILLALATSVLALINVFLMQPGSYNNPKLYSPTSYVSRLLDSSLVWVYMAIALWVGTALRIVLVHGFSWI